MQKLQEQIPVKTKSCAIIAVFHELSGLDSLTLDGATKLLEVPVCIGQGHNLNLAYLILADKLNPLLGLSESRFIGSITSVQQQTLVMTNFCDPA